MYLFTQVFKEHETIITRGVKLRFTTVFTLLNFCAQSFSQYWRQSSCHNINEASEVEQNRKNGVLIIPLFLHQNHDFRFSTTKSGIISSKFYVFIPFPLFLFISREEPSSSAPRPPSPLLTKESQKSNRGAKLVYTVRVTWEKKKKT